MIIFCSRYRIIRRINYTTTLQEGKVRDAILDVWEGEPNLSLPLLQRVFIGTPHIAGYSADGKANADNMVIEALCHHFALPMPDKITPPKLPSDFPYTGNSLELYNPMTDSQALKANPSSFEDLRNHYPLRREFLDI